MSCKVGQRHESKDSYGISGDKYEGTMFQAHSLFYKLGFYSSSQPQSSIKGDVQVWSLTKLEIEQAENILDNNLGNYYNHLKRHKRQYFGIYNSQGERIVFINGFHQSTMQRHPNWRKNIVFVLDGGNNYFESEINIDKKKVETFLFHGSA
jgi:hypothetical protein